VRAAHEPAVVAAKLYPAGATTNSERGVTRMERIGEVLHTMAEVGLPVLVHGEVTDPEVDPFDREAVFVDRVLEPLVGRFPGLRVVLEHVSSRVGVEFVRSARPGVAATVTPHHLLLDRRDLFRGGLRPHHYCLPVVKSRADREAVLGAATSGDPRFFLGTDSAPHPLRAKEAARAAAGIYSAHASLELYAEAFDGVGALDRLEAFAAFFGADFYGLDRSSATVTLVRSPWQVPATYPVGEDELVPLRAGGSVAWRLAGAEP
jgi:dihydroorotase